MNQLNVSTIHFNDPHYQPQQLMTPAARWVFLADSYYMEDPVRELLEEDERNWFVPSAVLEETMSFAEVVRARADLPIIEGGVVLDTFVRVNNQIEGTIPLPVFEPEATLGLRLSAPPVPDIPDDRLRIEDKIIRDIPSVVLLNPDGQEQDAFSEGEREVRLSEAFLAFQRQWNMVPDPYSEEFMIREGILPGPEGSNIYGFRGKEY